MLDTLEKPKRVVIVTMITPDFYDFDASFSELKELVKTAGGELVFSFMQRRKSLHPKSVVGDGKISEIADFCEANEIELVVFDRELSPTQVSYLTDRLNIEVIDRTMLILDIFSQRANSSEGKLQVELAKLNYLLPRLKGSYVGLSRLGNSGGMGATRGLGESQLELDKRHIRYRIQQLKSEIKEVQKRRNELRARRTKDGVKTCVIAGYTNSGKSTMLNALTDANVLSKDMLFATLDPTSQKLSLPNGKDIILIDTVGFIRRLPHHLVEAFKSTLEEVAYADLVVLLADISDNDCSEQIDVCKKIIIELGYSGKILTVCNKIDKVPFANDTTNALLISAKEKISLDVLLNQIANEIFGDTEVVNLIIPYSDSNTYYDLKNNYKIVDEKFNNDGYIVQVELTTLDKEKFEGYRYG